MTTETPERTLRPGRLSIEPLLRLDFPNDDPDSEWRWNTVVAAAAFKVSRGAVQRMVRDGVSYKRADELATMRGLHPADVWGDDWWAGVPPEGEGEDG